MNTFDAIAQIRREALSQAQALRFLMERFGFTVTYAREVVAVVFGDDDALSPVSISRADNSR